LLARGAASRATYNYAPSPGPLLAWVARAECVCAEYGVDLPTVALRFSLRSPLVDSTVVGISSASRLATLEHMRLAEVPDGVWSALDALGTPPSPITD
jgi:D-threo-aldose 1-dehydrogenase